MSAQPRFGRLLTAMVTPFDKDGALDIVRSAELANRLFDTGSEGLVVCGTTGESPTVFYDQKIELFRAVLDGAGSRGPIIANVGDNCTDDSVSFAREVTKLGVDGVMLVTPYYNKPPQEGLYRHFRKIAESVDVPVVLYNIPGRCVINIEPETVLRLANDVENIVALKQANPDLSQARTIIEGAPDGFEVLSGDDGLTLPMMKLGATGVISVLSHVAGPYVKEMIEAIVAKDEKRALKLYEILMPLIDAIFLTSNPIMVKDALATEGFDVGGVRLPLVEPTAEQHAELVSVMNDTFSQLNELD
ncbi:MAG: 4-hydroxy-tetrahydrodipicolinate synthase [Coriobacteriia bacterium]|nr:4-hydroxy-tetrahydrodipicolinate synthase [Coriobacteriia bacterium]